VAIAVHTSHPCLWCCVVTCALGGDCVHDLCTVQNLYVLQRSWEGGGRLFDAFFIQVLWCLFLMVLFVGKQ